MRFPVCPPLSFSLTSQHVHTRRNISLLGVDADVGVDLYSQELLQSEAEPANAKGLL